MQIACHTWAYDHLSLREAVGTIARLGFRAVDIGSGPHLKLGDIARDPERYGQEVRQIAVDFNMVISDLYLVMTHINSPDPQVRNTRLRLFDRLVNFALITGAEGITISPGIIHDDGDAHSLARSIPCLQYMSDLTQSRGIRLSFEPHLDSIAPNPEKAELILAAVPNLTLTLDIAHWITQGYGWRDIKPMLNKSTHIQVRQARPKRLQTPFKKGKLDIPRLVRDLAAIEYDGTLSIEYMNAVGWHGMMKVDVTQEISQTRTAIRQARTELFDKED